MTNLQIAMYVCTGVNFLVCIVYVYLHFRAKRQIKEFKRLTEINQKIINDVEGLEE